MPWWRRCIPQSASTDIHTNKSTCHNDNDRILVAKCWSEELNNHKISWQKEEHHFFTVPISFTKKLMLHGIYYNYNLTITKVWRLNCISHNLPIWYNYTFVTKDTVILKCCQRHSLIFLSVVTGFWSSWGMPGTVPRHRWGRSSNAERTNWHSVIKDAYMHHTNVRNREGSYRICGPMYMIKFHQWLLTCHVHVRRLLTIPSTHCNKEEIKERCGIQKSGDDNTTQEKNKQTLLA